MVLIKTETVEGQVMIFGKPYEFAVFYELLEKTEDDFWKYGIFVFFIDDEIYPSKGSNYTLHMAMSYLKDCNEDITMCKNTDLSIYKSDFESFLAIAHSHGLLLDIRVRIERCILKPY